MYRVVKDGATIGYCDEPVYIRQKDGIWVNCGPDDAQAIAFGGEAIEGAIATQIGTEVYVGDEVARIEDAICEMSMEDEDGENLEE